VSLYNSLVDPIPLVHSSGRLKNPSSFEKAHAWWDAMDIGSKSIMDVMIASCIDRYSDTSTTYSVNILAQWEGIEVNIKYGYTLTNFDL